MEEPHYLKAPREAAERLQATLALPLPDDQDYIGCEGNFDPWDLFPSLYGTYSQEFDTMALEVLISLEKAGRDDWPGCYAMQREETLAHEMFREMLCTANLCTYGTSPRVCFPECDFRPLLTPLIDKWAAFSNIHWDEPNPAMAKRAT